MDGGGLEVPVPGSAPGEQAVAFAAGLIDRSGTAPVIEAALAHRTGRRRPLPARAVLTALLCLALDDRPLFLTEVTRLLFCQLPPAGRRLLGVPGTATTPRAFKAAYRRVRYCFHAIVSVADPSPLPKNRRLTAGELLARTKPMAPGQATAARDRLEALVNALLEASVSVLDQGERAAHQALAAPARRRVRGIAACSLFTALLLIAANIRKIRAWRALTVPGKAGITRRARQRRASLRGYLPGG
jgi:hypothetical protein